MFEHTNESVVAPSIEFSTEYGNTEFQSAVDLIQVLEVPVKTVADVKKKARQTNLATVVNTLKAVTDDELEDCTPSVMKELLAEATRLYNTYKNIID
jgi:uncharacterized FAD-dependent dehydrogenase